MHGHRLPKEVGESPSPEVFKEDVVLRDMVQWAIPAVGGWLDWTILEVFSNLHDSITCTEGNVSSVWQCSQQQG